MEPVTASLITAGLAAGSSAGNAVAQGKMNKKTMAYNREMYDKQKADNIASAIIETVNEKEITTICIGKPHIKLFQIILRTNVFNQLLKTLTKNNIDLVILS